MFRSLTRATTPIPSPYQTVTNSISFRPSIAPLFYTFSSTSSSLRNNGEGSSDDEDEDAGAFTLSRDTEGPPKLFVVQPRLRPESVLQAKLSEALNLARSLEDRRDWSGGEECGEKRTLPHLVVQNPMIRSKGRADKFFGPGTVENVKCHLHAIDSDGELDGIFVNATLSGIQQRNLETAWGKPVLDRVALIIEIFNAHAQTKEAKLQSELAALMYRSTRLVRARGPSGRLTFGMSGEAEVVSAKGKGSGGRGFLSGAGESELQLQRRRIQERREKLLHEIEEVRRTRALQRYGRKRRGGSLGQGLATVAVVGYTNAGKSTLVSALSRSDLYRDDRLFATVDPRLRSVILPSGRKALLSDTVGFISDLPVQLVEAFHATLEEVVDADLLLHVLDSSAENLEEQRSAVLQVLQQIGVSEEKLKNMIEVWNKVDLLDKEHGISVIPDKDKNDEKIANSDLDLNEQLLQQPSKEQAVGNVPTDTTDIVDMDDFMGKDQNKKAVGNCGHGEAVYANAYMEMVDDVESSLSPGDPTVDIDGEDQKEISHDTDDDTERMLMGESSYDNLSPGSLIHKRLTADALSVYQPKCIQRVETSAMMGVGLQQLLHLIDLKLGNGKSPEKESQSEIFDRKWRPSNAKASVQ